MQRCLKKAFFKVPSKPLNQSGFSLIELVLAILISFLLGSAIMDGTVLYRKKMVELQVKEKAFEELLNYTDFYKSMIFSGKWTNYLQTDFQAKEGKVILFDSYVDKNNDDNDDHECKSTSNEDDGCIFGTIYYRILEGNSEYISDKYYYLKLNTQIIWELQGVKDTLEFEVDQIVK